MWSPQQWQSEKLGRSLVFFRNRSEDESDERDESEEVEHCLGLWLGLGLGLGLERRRFREGDWGGGGGGGEGKGRVLVGFMGWGCGELSLIVNGGCGVCRESF